MFEINKRTIRAFISVAGIQAVEDALKDMKEEVADFFPSGVTVGNGKTVSFNGHSKAKAKTSKGSKGKKKNRTAEEVQEHKDMILKVLRGRRKDGYANPDIVEATGIDKRHVTTSLTSMRDAGLVKVKGERNHARWFIK